MKTNKETIASYEEILNLMKSNSDIFVGDINIKSKLESRISAMRLSNDFGIEVSSNKLCGSHDYANLSEHIRIGLFGKSLQRTISCSDDNTQPDNEWLYIIKFPTGAYIFGSSYPTVTFNKFFEELKSYNPKYIDSMNHVLYYTKENAKAVHEIFDILYAKYRDISIEESKQNKIADLEKQIKYIKNTTRTDYILDDKLRKEERNE